MTQRKSPAGDRLSGARGYPLARLGLAALLILLAAAGLRAGLPRLTVDGPYIRDELPIAAILEGIVLCLLLVVLIRHARAPGDHQIAARMRELLRSVLIAAAVAVPLAYLLTRTIHVSAQRKLPRIPPVAGRGGRQFGPQHLPHGLLVFATVLDIVLLTLLAGAIVIGGYALARRRWRWQAARRQPLPAPAELSEPDAQANLRRAVESGWLALRALDDARGAIIACYLAMEESLARAGTARHAAETPDELLARAAASGLVRGTAAARLTAVFYAARFSTRELTQTQRDTAEQALAEIAESLSEPVQ